MESSLTQDYYLNTQPNTDSIIKQLTSSQRLQSDSSHKQESILFNLKKRLAHGIPYTYVGSLLLSINASLNPTHFFNHPLRSTFTQQNETPKPHVYSISLAAYKKLKFTGQNQTISLLGTCGAGKTFNVIHIVDHLIQLSSNDFLSQSVNSHQQIFKNLHQSFQALHIMGSISRKHNSQSSSCGIVVQLLFDVQYRVISGRLKGSLLNLSMPYYNKGRTYQVLHSLLYAQKAVLQRLGLNQNGLYKLFGRVEQGSRLDYEV